MLLKSPRGRQQIDADAMQLAAIATESVSPLDRLERKLHPWSSFLVIPIFALANAGVRFTDLDFGEAALHPVSLGVGIGLFVGKAVGISLATWLALRFGVGRLPRRTNWNHVIGLAFLAGIGFTVSLFITELAFVDEFLTDSAKIGIFAGSILSGIVGYTVLRVGSRTRRDSGGGT
jgi:NhaA family Na+:H+ antiporter